jgi:murein DD-endopeptidase MepM/ murein hydrolase activator NlpD
LASNRTHHRSKRSRFTLVFSREEDAANARSFRLAKWQLVLVTAIAVMTVGAAFYALVTLTPVAEFIPLPNPALENKYSRELLALNRRVLGMMEELVRLRAYNVRLRNALGERVAMTDSGDVVELPTGSTRRVREAVPPSQGEMAQPVAVMPAVPRSVPLATSAAQELSGAIAFPAILPAQGYITRGYANDINHYGLDIAGKTGSLVVVAADGTVLFSGWTPDDGTVLIVAHGGGFVTAYKHLQSALRPAGARVRRGDPIGLLGDSGRTSTGPHLHFEIWKDGVPVDPTRYLINLAS